LLGALDADEDEPLDPPEPEELVGAGAAGWDGGDWAGDELFAAPVSFLGGGLGSEHPQGAGIAFAVPLAVRAAAPPTAAASTYFPLGRLRSSPGAIGLLFRVSAVRKPRYSTTRP
jgi:hypothetical protein